MGNPTQWRQAVSGEAAWKKGIFELLQLPAATGNRCLLPPVHPSPYLFSLSLSLSFFLASPPRLVVSQHLRIPPSFASLPVSISTGSFLFLRDPGLLQMFVLAPNPQPMSEVGLAILSSHLFRKNTNPIILNCHTCGSGCMTLCICGPEYYLANVIYYPVMMMLLMMVVVIVVVAVVYVCKRVCTRM